MTPRHIVQEINGVPIWDTFAEAFPMKATRLVITAIDAWWCDQAVQAMCGFGTSVIACGLEIAREQTLAPESTPDGRPGASILAFGMSGKELLKQIPVRAGQCVLTCPTTSLYAGLPMTRQEVEKRIPLGKSVRYFGDGHQIAKVLPAVDENHAASERDVEGNWDERTHRYWRIPVMDGEFVCQHDVAQINAIGGGNFILLGRSLASVSRACRAASMAMAELPGVITPFPGGATRSGSKVGSKYAKLFASTNEAYCPTLRHLPGSVWSGTNGGDGVEVAALEIVIDGINAERIATAMKAGIQAACDAVGPDGLLAVTAGNYGGKLGPHHFHLRDVLNDAPEPDSWEGTW
ncbi:MAG: formylmethanofuran--tetrahydromethanopterin N-formyltransferase [Planctomycetota bacterium]